VGPARAAQRILDVVVLVAALWLACLLRFDFRIPMGEAISTLVQTPIVVVVQLAALGWFGVNQFIWRYVGLAEMAAFVRAMLVSALVLVALRLSLPSILHVWRVPLSVTLVDAVLAFGGVVALRVARRAYFERYEQHHTLPGGRVRKPVLFVGAGRAGIMAAREVQNTNELDIEVRGFVDDDPMKQGSVIHGVKVLGTTAALPTLVREHGIDHVVITIARAPRGSMRRIIEICEQNDIRARVIPGLFELLDGKVQVNRIRDVDIEDLLGRDPVQLDPRDVSAFLENKVVLITGAGGSIGGELCRQVVRFGPKALVLVEQAENALFLIHKELQALAPDVHIVPVIADIVDVTRMEHVLSQHKPHAIFHAAAHKHVPMMEENPGEAVKNNVFGTRGLVDLADKHEVERFVMISTDKAVNPTSVMGATKRTAELYLQAKARTSRTRFVAVRFGNVLGSNGSVVPLFKEQIARGGPVKVTHPDMKRYFMTIPEASQLVLQAGTMGHGGEIFILDMGEPVKIVDLARDLISLSGLRPGVDIQIEFIGLRPGEKLFEELSVADENADTTRHPKIFVGKLRALSIEVVAR
jgi:FlaA1/EpsC-like NDP-sugar epimerase